MLKAIKKLFQSSEIKVSQDKQAIVLSEQEMKAIIGAGSSRGAARTDSF